MEKLSASKSSTVLSWGLYLGLASIVLTLIVSYGGLMGNAGVGLLSYVLIVVMLVLGLKHYKEKENEGFLKYGQGLGIGSLIGLVGGGIHGIFTYVLYAIIDPSLHQKIVAISQEKALEKGTSEAQLEQVESVMELFLSPAMLSFFTILGTVLMAFIFSLIIAAILKKDPEPEF